jgi:hypothetical protein
MMEAADATEVSGSETAVGVADTVDAGMEGVSAAVTAAVTASVSPAVSAAVTTARRRDSRRESCRNDRCCESNGERRFSKHGFISSAGRPPSAMLPPSAEPTLNVASRMREPVAISALQAFCRRRCQVGVSKIVKTNWPRVEGGHISQGTPARRVECSNCVTNSVGGSHHTLIIRGNSSCFSSPITSAS